jgi:ComEC/Rec2-related protein
VRSLVAVACAFLLGLLVPAPCSALNSALGRGGLALAALAFGLLLAAAPGLRVPALIHRAGSWLVAPAAFAAGLAVGSPSSESLPIPPAGLARLWVVVDDVSHLEPAPPAAAGVAKQQLRRGLSRARVLRGHRLHDGAPVRAGTRLVVAPHALPEGATLQLVATLRPRVPFRNLSPHSELPSARAAHTHALLPGPDAYHVEQHPWHARLIWLGRSAMRQRLDDTLASDVAGVARALTLGDPASVSPADQADVRSSGLSHVFAVSGMHVTLLAGFVVLALRRCLVCVYPLAARFDSRRLAAGLGVPCAIFIGAFTGAAPSGMRAALTSALAWVLYAMGRRPAPAAVCALASLGFAAVWPGEALRPAFLLSIAATSAIVAAPQPPLATLGEALAAAARLSLRTSVATAPIVLWTFGSLPVVGVLANLLLVPVGSLLLVLAVLHALVACLLPSFASWTAWPLELTSGAFLRGCAWFAELDPELLIPVLSDAQGALLVIAVCIVLFVQRRRRYYWLTLGALVLAFAAAEWNLRRTERPHGVLRASFLDVGQGDATLLDLPDGRCMLSDGGGNPQGGADPGARAIVPLLRARRRSHIDVIVLSHPHPDHYGGLSAVLDAVSVGEVWDSGQADAEAEQSGTSRQALDWLTRARAKGTRVLGPRELCVRASACVRPGERGRAVALPELRCRPRSERQLARAARGISRTDLAAHGRHRGARRVRARRQERSPASRRAQGASPRLGHVERRAAAARGLPEPRGHQRWGGQLVWSPEPRRVAAPARERGERDRGRPLGRGDALERWTRLASPDVARTSASRRLTGAVEELRLPRLARRLDGLRREGVHSRRFHGSRAPRPTRALPARHWPDRGLRACPGSPRVRGRAYVDPAGCARGAGYRTRRSDAAAWSGPR